MTNKRNLFTLLVMLLFASSSENVLASIDPIPLEVGYVDPILQNTHRGPVLIPEVSIEDYTLYFDTPCDGCVLRVVNELGVVEYTTVIPVGADELVLPSYLFGEYELQIIRDNWCFYGDITLGHTGTDPL